MEFINQKFGASLGGCPDGIPAQKGGKGKQVRNARSGEQSETNVMVSLPGGHGGPIDRDIGAKNVNLRPSEEAVDLKNNKAGMSEVQRLESAMKDMLASFKQKV